MSRERVIERDLRLTQLARCNATRGQGGRIARGSQFQRVIEQRGSALFAFQRQRFRQRECRVRAGGFAADNVSVSRAFAPSSSARSRRTMSGQDA